MKKQEFLAFLRQELAGLPKEDLERSLSYYSEMVDDRIEDGCGEEEAVAALGSLEEIRAQILSETPLKKLVGQRFKRKRPLAAWEIVLLIIGSPLWVPLVATALILLATGYGLIWVFVGVLFTVDFALAFSGIELLISLFVGLFTGNFIGAIFFLGGALVCAGGAILLFFAAIKVAKLVFRWTKKCLLWMKDKMLGKKEEGE